MNSRLILLALVFGIVAVGLATRSAFACTENLDEAYLCVDWTAPKPVAAAGKATVPDQTLLASAAPVRRTGKTPEEAFEANDIWLPMPAKTTFWYKMPYASNPLKLEVWVDVYGRTGVTMEIFSPDKENNLWNEKPTGRGAYNKAEASHDLWWTGESLVPGSWYARVTNNNDFSIDHRVGYRRVNFTRNCVQYMETLYAGGSPILWTLCNKSSGE